jgi:hypothetical protein
MSTNSHYSDMACFHRPRRLLDRRCEKRELIGSNGDNGQPVRLLEALVNTSK